MILCNLEVKKKFHSARDFSNKKWYLLSCDEAKEPRGQEAVLDDQWHLSVYEPLFSQFSHSFFGPFDVRIHQWLPLFHPFLVLKKQKTTDPLKMAGRM